jgi:hypothetical protein
VLNTFGTKWVGCCVRYTTGSVFQRWVSIGVASSTSGDHIKVVFCAILLGTDSISGFLCFAEFGVVAITLTVTAVGVRGL